MKLIAAVDENWGIGYQNALLFRIPEDLKRFQALTSSNIVVMGRNTLLSLPNGAPLRERENIVLTSDASLHVPQGAVCNSLPMLARLLLTPRYAGKEVYVIGGARVYAALLPYCGTALITHIHESKQADCHLPALDTLKGWTRVEMGPNIDGNPSFAYARYRNNAVLPFVYD